MKHLPNKPNTWSTVKRIKNLDRKIGRTAFYKELDKALNGGLIAVVLIAALLMSFK